MPGGETPVAGDARGETPGGRGPRSEIDWPREDVLYTSHMCYENNTSSPSRLVHRVAQILIPGARTVLAASIALGNLATPSVASAQSGGTFSGTLVDAVGRILPDEPMALTNVQTGARHETRSDGSGRFAFTTLESGDFTLDATVPGFATLYRIALAPGQRLQRDVALQVGAVHETITLLSTSAIAPPRAPAPMTSTLADTGPCGQTPVGVHRSADQDLRRQAALSGVSAHCRCDGEARGAHRHRRTPRWVENRRAG
jgi:hypothetical protein